MPVLNFCCWLALVWGAGWLFWPQARRIFGDTLPDGGLAVGRVLFLAFWTLSAFWVGHAGVSTRLTALLWLLPAATGIRFALQDRAELRNDLRTKRRAIVTSEAVFLLVFFGFFALRGFWSDTNGDNGEKSMDSALIGSIARAEKLPPPNPYAAGANLRGYYYFGHLETALLTNATGTTNRWSYNLMCATLPALCFSTLFSLGAALTRRLSGGFFVAGAVLCLGTLQPIIQWMNPTKFRTSPPFKLDFFVTSRVIPFTINEFPWFTFNQSDLHAHYFDFIFALATMCLAYAIFRGQKAALIPAALVLGAQVMTNTWDYPAYGVVLGLSVLAATSLLRPKTDPTLETQPAKLEKPAIRQQWPVRALLGLAIVLAALIVAAPYLLNLKTAANRPKLLHQPASSLREWLFLWGPFVMAWFAFAAYTIFKTPKSRTIFYSFCGGLAIAVLSQAWMTPWFVVSDPIYTGSPLVLPLILISLAISIAGAFRLRGRTQFLCLLAIGGLVALLWSEVTWAGFLGDPNTPGPQDAKRQDTVFKFGLQTWMLWGVAASAGAFLTLRKWPEMLKSAFVLMLPVMVIASMAPVLGRARDFSRWDGWDGWAHMAPPEKEAAAWLQAHTPPGQNLIEAENQPGGDYTVYTRFAHATGIPTLIGPQAHSFQWSPANSGDAAKEWDEVFRRKNDVRTFYMSPDILTRKEILSKYKVRYIVCGELERAEYGDAVVDTLRATYRQEVRFGAHDDPRQVWIFAAPGT
ncbi:hypothetical protein EON80_04455 [bacterium]|nr:MAG: hypothetical protein EON80_04455 [bacterium]